MINTLEEMFQEMKYEELVELFEKCSSKNKDEIIQIFKEKGYEISDDFALEFLKCYEEVTPINDADLSYAAGGSDNGSDLLPEFAITQLKKAIKYLEEYTPFNGEAQDIIDELNDLLTNSYDAPTFAQKLGVIHYRVIHLPTLSNHLAKIQAGRCISSVLKMFS